MVHDSNKTIDGVDYNFDSKGVSKQIIKQQTSGNSNNGNSNSSLTNQAKEVLRSLYVGTYGSILFSLHSQCVDMQVQMTNATVKFGYVASLESLAKSGLSIAKSLRPVNSTDVAEISFAISASNNYIK